MCEKKRPGRLHEIAKEEVVEKDVEDRLLEAALHVRQPVVGCEARVNLRLAVMHTVITVESSDISDNCYVWPRLRSQGRGFGVGLLDVR